MKLDNLYIKLFIDTSELDKAIEKADILKEKLNNLGMLKVKDCKDDDDS